MDEDQLLTYYAYHLVSNIDDSLRQDERTAQLSSIFYNMNVESKDKQPLSYFLLRSKYLYKDCEEKQSSDDMLKNAKKYVASIQAAKGG
jgi:hypothetical protein